MCSINFAVVPESTVDPILKINGRYRLSGEVNWILFPVTVSNPQTPDIPLIGTYDMGIQIETAGGVSEWFDTVAAFSDSRSCDKGPIDTGGGDPIDTGGGDPIDTGGGGGGGDEIIAPDDGGQGEVR